MKKFAMLMCVIVFVIEIAGCAWGGVSLGAFPDPVFREYLKGYDTGWSWDEYVPEGYWGGGGYWYYWRTVWEGRDDGILSDIEMERIPCSLDIYNIGIKSLKGIEHLTMLTELNCSINQLTELDVSKNIALKTLNCSGNQLTELDVSSNKALTDLRCSGNQLTELDVSSNTLLETLYCENNQLTELDVSRNVVLKTLYCGNNQLTELDVSRNINLTLLECIYNQLTELDVSKNTALTILSCWCNQLTELDMSKNTALSGLACYGQKRRDLNVKQMPEGWQINFKDYISCLEDIDSNTISPAPLSYDKETGIATFSEPLTRLSYYYMTRSRYNDVMDVTIINPLSISAIERSGSGIDGLIISDMTDSSYLNSRENALTELDISESTYGKKGLTADGNSRLIIRVQTDKPGKISFSFNDDIGAKLESLSREKLSASDQLNTVEIYSYFYSSYVYQASAVLIAPERFPEDKNFPSDTFKVHVKFTDEDGEITEDDLELKLEAAPVILIPGMIDTIEPRIKALLPGMLPLYDMRYRLGDAGYTFGSSNNSGIWRELIEEGFKEEHIALFDYNGATGVKNNVDSLFNTLKKMFDTYAQEGIVCTKADVVAHGLGGLLVRQYLDESSKDGSSSSNNNWSEISYKQGMIHRVVNIAVPHRGTPLANVMLRDLSVINLNSGLPKVRDKAAYLMLKYFPTSSTEVYLASKEALKDLSVGSEVTNLSFPAKVPMHFIYGDVKNSLDKLENIKDWLFIIGGVRDIWNTLKKLRGRLNELEKAAAPLEKVHSRAITEDGVLDETTFQGVTKLLNRNNMLRLQEFMKTVIKIAQNGMAFAEKISHSPRFTEFMKHADFIMVALGGASNLITMPIDLYFVIPSLLFSGQPHDFFVPKSSAIAAFPEYSTGFPVTSGLLDILYFRYSEICHQNDVGEFVGYLLKDAPLSKFVMLEESLPLPGSVSSKTSSNGASDSDIEIDLENFYVKNFSLAIRKSTSEDFGDGMTALKFIADSTIKTSNDVKLVIQKDGFDRIFPMFTEDVNKFEAILVFQSGDEGAMTAYCYAPSDKGNLYISDTVEFSYLDMFEDEEPDSTPPRITIGELTCAVTGQSYTSQLRAYGTAPITWTHTGRLPAGLTLSESGLISGTPTKAGKSSFTIKVTNAYGTASSRLTLRVFDPVSISTANLKDATISKNYNATFKAKGTRPITWSAEGLPNGLTMNAKTGRISGKPSVYGTFSMKITASNGAGSLTKEFALKVKAIPPKITGNLARAELNGNYSSGLRLAAGSTPVTWLLGGILPEGLTFDPETGIISGIPTEYGRFKLSLTASNDGGTTRPRTVTLNVKGTPPRITTAKLPDAEVGKTYTITLTATGSSPITWTAENLPVGLELDGDTIKGTPTESGRVRITVYAANPVRTVKRLMTLKITPAVSSLPDTAKNDVENVSAHRESIAYLPVHERNGALSLTKNYVVVAELPVISCDEAGMYDFSVELSDDVAVGAELVYIANSDTPSEDDGIAEFYDETGKEISAVPENRRISISIWLNPETVYHPEIVVKD